MIKWMSFVFMFSSTLLLAEVQVGKMAPAFSEKDQTGKLRTMGDLKGKWVVLEWFNEGCPYVKKHYKSGNMQALQKKYTGKGVEWLTVISSAKGKQGYVEMEKAKEQVSRVKMKSTALLLDPDGSMGRSFGAKTTPHMYIVNPKGKVVYAGAIDSNDSADPATIKGATNYVAAALDSAMSGKPVAKSSTKPYGCSVKYSSGT